jgi:redox-sensitive bicupin YhaK (pirin superfamily)
MTAGAGIVHSERTPPDRRAVTDRIHGLQTWVVLPVADQTGPAGFQHVGADELPVIDLSPGSATIVVGEAWGRRSPVETLGDPLLIDVRLPRGAVLARPSPAEEIGVYVVSGQVEVGVDVLAAGQLGVLGPGDDLSITAAEDTVLALLAGPHVAPPHVSWNFVSNDARAIEDARRRWVDDEFGHVPGETERVPLP